MRTIRLLEMDDGQYQYLYNCLRVWYCSWYCWVQLKSVSSIKIQFRRMEGQHIIVTIFVFAKVALFYTGNIHFKLFYSGLFTFIMHAQPASNQLQYLLLYLVILTEETNTAAILICIRIVDSQLSSLSNIFLTFPDELQRQSQFGPFRTHSLRTNFLAGWIWRSEADTFYVLPMDNCASSCFSYRISPIYWRRWCVSFKQTWRR